MTDSTTVAEEEKKQYVDIETLQQKLEGLDTNQVLDLYHETGDEQIKWVLVLRYEGFIKSMAQQIRGVYHGFAQVDDVVNEGILTLLSAIDKFDPTKGAKFETYVAKRIRGMVVDMARKQDWLPRTIRRRAREVDQVITLLSGELGRYPSEQEVADRLGISVERYNKDMASVALSNVLSLDMLMEVHEQDGGQFELPSQDLSGQPDVFLQEQEQQKALADGIRTLRKNEQTVLSLYYEKNLHMKEIAQVMDVSEPRISQIHASAIQKLRTYMNNYLNGIADEPKSSKKRKKG